MMDIKNIYGRRMGFIKDILVDFNLGKVSGFKVSSKSISSKNECVFAEDIIAFGKYMIVKRAVKDSGLIFREIRNLEVVDLDGNVIGMFEDIIIDELLKIKAIVISLGIVRNIIEGKKLILINDIIIGDKNILITKRNDKISFISNPHQFLGGDKNE
jgi:uncharacterized protein YrrD